jgi:hypothetical protein
MGHYGHRRDQLAGDGRKGHANAPISGQIAFILH